MACEVLFRQESMTVRANTLAEIHALRADGWTVDWDQNVTFIRHPMGVQIQVTATRQIPPESTLAAWWKGSAALPPGQISQMDTTGG